MMTVRLTINLSQEEAETLLQLIEEGQYELARGERARHVTETATRVMLRVRECQENAKRRASKEQHKEAG